MSAERITKSPHDFWLKTCGIDTWRRSSGHAQLDTPWNGFTSENILVCTVWVDEILSISDDKENRIRRFVKLGGRLRSWQGPAVKHGEEAQNNLTHAFRERLRVIGYEAEPITTGEQRKKIAHFYMDRAHELERMRLLSHGDMLERLKIAQRFKDVEHANDDFEIEEGTIFEIVPPKGVFPAIAVSSGDTTVDISEEVNDSKADDSEDEYVGNLSNRDYAELVIPLLVAHVLRERDDVLHPLTYEELAALLGRRNKYGMPAPRGLGKVLGMAMSLIDTASESHSGDVPYLTTIVVAKSGKSKGLPEVGVRERWYGYDTMTKEEKLAKVMNEYSRILNFGPRWNAILAALGMKLAQTPEYPAEPAGSAGGWSGGESAQHKALKAYVMSHPELFGADPTWEAYEEYALRSGDTIDVFFKSPDKWIAVEVKSLVSDGNELDYQRGLFQVVKYEAVLKAHVCADQPKVPPAITVLLALEGQLPVGLRNVAKALKIDVRENVRVLDAEVTSPLKRGAI